MFYSYLIINKRGSLKSHFLTDASFIIALRVRGRYHGKTFCKEFMSLTLVDPSHGLCCLQLNNYLYVSIWSISLHISSSPSAPATRSPADINMYWGKKSKLSIWSYEGRYNWVDKFAETHTILTTFRYFSLKFHILMMAFLSISDGW